MAGIANKDGSNPGYSLLFQHYTGQIRQLFSKDQNIWSGGSNLDIVVGSNARNGTPLTTGTYKKDNITWVKSALQSENRFVTNQAGK